MLNEYVLYNKEITVAKKTLIISQFQTKYGYNLKVMDLLDSSGILLERNTLNKSLQSNLSQMSYNCLSSAIPKSWKEKLKYQKVDCFERWPDEIYIKIINKYVILNKVRNKQIYEELDWANSAPTYPQTGHHSRHRF